MDTITWGLNETIEINLFVGDPESSQGLVGQVPYLVLTIQDQSTNNYWNGTSFNTPVAPLTFTEVDQVNQPGRYTYLLPATMNTTPNRYVAHSFINNPPLLVGDSYELHVTRDLLLKVYESEPA